MHFVCSSTRLSTKKGTKMRTWNKPVIEIMLYLRLTNKYVLHVSITIRNNNLDITWYNLILFWTIQLSSVRPQASSSFEPNNCPLFDHKLPRLLNHTTVLNSTTRFLVHAQLTVIICNNSQRKQNRVGNV